MNYVEQVSDQLKTIDSLHPAHHLLALRLLKGIDKRNGFVQLSMDDLRTLCFNRSKPASVDTVKSYLAALLNVGIIDHQTLRDGSVLVRFTAWPTQPFQPIQRRNKRLEQAAAGQTEPLQTPSAAALEPLGDGFRAAADGVSSQFKTGLEGSVQGLTATATTSSTPTTTTLKPILKAVDGVVEGVVEGAGRDVTAPSQPAANPAQSGSPAPANRPSYPIDPLMVRWSKNRPEPKAAVKSKASQAINTQLDLNKLVNGRIPAGQGINALEVWYENRTFNEEGDRLRSELEGVLLSRVKAAPSQLDNLRQAMERWDMK